jgi:hypothetical protein
MLDSEIRTWFALLENFTYLSQMHSHWVELTHGGPVRQSQSIVQVGGLHEQSQTLRRMRSNKEVNRNR